MTKRLSILAILALLLIPPRIVQAQSNICQGDPCTADEVGVFMEGISNQCGNSGTCSLNDIMIVFENVGNFVTSIVGALVLLMYVIGGIFFLTAGGSQERISKGKQFFKFATIGLMIVLFGFVAVTSLKNAIVTGELACSPGEACGDNMVCSEFGECITECEDKKGEEDEPWACVDTSLPENEDLRCEIGLCPGGNNIRCCNLSGVKTAE